MKSSIFSKLKSSLTVSPCVIKSKEGDRSYEEIGQFRERDSVNHDKQINEAESIYRPYLSNSVKNIGEQKESYREFTFEKRQSHFRKIRQKIYSPKSVDFRKQFREKQNFYVFYKNELVRTKTQNVQLLKRIEVLQSQISQKNAEVNKISKRCKVISERLERLEREEDNLRVTIEKKDEIIGEHTKILDSLNSLRDRKVILNPEREKRENIGMQDLIGRIQEYEEQNHDYLRTKDENYELREKYVQLKLRYTQMYEKAYKYTPVIQHLWDIKQIQYEHLMDRLKQCRDSK